MSIEVVLIGRRVSSGWALSAQERVLAEVKEVLSPKRKRGLLDRFGVFDEKFLGVGD